MKKNLLAIIILALVVVNLVLTAIMMFSVTSASSKTTALVGDIASVLNLEINGYEKAETAPTSVALADSIPYSIPEAMTVPLKKGEDGVAHYAILQVSFSLDKTKEGYKTFDETVLVTYQPVIQDIIIEVIGNYTIDEATDAVGKENMKAEILQKVQEQFASDHIYKVMFSDFKTQ